MLNAVTISLFYTGKVFNYRIHGLYKSLLLLSNGINLIVVKMEMSVGNSDECIPVKSVELVKEFKPLGLPFRIFQYPRIFLHMMVWSYALRVMDVGINLLFALAVIGTLLAIQQALTPQKVNGNQYVTS